MRDRAGWRNAGSAAAACLVAVFVPACLGGPAPPDRHYRLEACVPAQRLDAPALAGTLEISRFRAEALTGSRQILDRPDGGAELRARPYDRWTDPPPVMAQVALARYLRLAGAAERVVTPELRATPDFSLAGRILRLERLVGDGEPRVVVELEVGVSRRSDGDLLLLETYREERPAGGTDVGRAVGAMGEALADIFARLIADLAAGS